LQNEYQQMVVTQRASYKSIDISQIPMRSSDAAPQILRNRFGLAPAMALAGGGGLQKD